MRICWEFLDNLKLTSGGRLTKMWGVPKHKTSQGCYTYEERYLWCGDDYIRPESSKTLYCTKKCKSNHTIWKIEEEKIKKELQRKAQLSRRNKKIMERNERGKIIRKTAKFAKYDTKYTKELSWCEETRRSPENNLLLEAKCIKCHNWFIPTNIQAANRERSLKKEKNGMYFYCSDNCKKACVLSYMTVPEIMRYDALNAGRIWLYIPDKWKYYDWKDEFNKWVRKEQEKYKNYLLREEKRKERLLEKKKKKKKKNEKNKVRKRWLEWISSTEGKMYTKEYNKRMILQKYYRGKITNPLLHKAKRLLYYSKVRSKQKKMEHNIDLNWISGSIKKKCVKTGLPFSLDMKRDRDPFAPSIDRINNNSGYTIENCQLVIWAYNTAKAEFSDDDIYKMAKAYLTSRK